MSTLHYDPWDLLNNTTNNMTGMAGIGGSLVGTGLNAAGTAGGLANNRFANNTGLFNIADQSQLGRMTLGGNLTNSMLNNQVDWGIKIWQTVKVRRGCSVITLAGMVQHLIHSMLESKHLTRHIREFTTKQ